MCKKSIYFKFIANLYSCNEFKEEEENKKTTKNSNVLFKKFKDLFKPVSREITVLTFYSDILFIMELCND